MKVRKNKGIVNITLTQDEFAAIGRHLEMLDTLAQEFERQEKAGKLPRVWQPYWDQLKAFLLKERQQLGAIQGGNVTASGELSIEPTNQEGPQKTAVEGADLAHDPCCVFKRSNGTLICCRNLPGNIAVDFFAWWQCVQLGLNIGGWSNIGDVVEAGACGNRPACH